METEFKIELSDTPMISGNIIRNSKGQIVARVYGSTPEEINRNTRLFAASMQMFKTLENALHTIEIINKVLVVNGSRSQETIIEEIKIVLKEADNGN